MFLEMWQLVSTAAGTFGKPGRFEASARVLVLSGHA